MSDISPSFAVSNGYSSYSAFLNNIFSTERITYGGPDVRGGAEMYTLGVTCVAPSLLAATSFIDSLKELGEISTGLLDSASLDIQKANPPKKIAQFVDLVRKGGAISGFIEAPQYNYTVKTQLLENVKPLESLVTINYDNRVWKLRKSHNFSTNGPIDSFPEMKGFIQIYAAIDRTLSLQVAVPDVQGRAPVYPVGIVTWYPLNRGQSYILSISRFDFTIKLHSLERDSLIESDSQAKSKYIDALCLFPADKEITEDHILQVPQFVTKINELKRKDILPFAILTVPPSETTPPPVELNVTPSTGFRLIRLDKLCLANPSGDLTPTENYLLAEAGKFITSALNIANSGASAYKTQVAKSPSYAWKSLTPTTIPVVKEVAIPTLQYLRHIKDQTKSNEVPSSDIVAQILNVLDTLLKYLNLISEFIRQINIFIKIVTTFFNALTSLSELNIYVLVTPAPMATTEDIKQAYLTAQGLPVSEDLHYGSAITVFSVPTWNSITAKLASDYGIPEGQPLPQFLSDKVRIIEKDSPSSARQFQQLLDFLNKYIFNNR